MGQMASTVETPRTDPGMMGPMPGTTDPAAGGNPGSGLLGMLGGIRKMTDFASLLGDTQEERVQNAQKFAALVKDVGNVVQDAGESTLMQRMMQASMSGPMYLDSGANPSGGVAAIPRTFDPAMASQIMSRTSFK